MDIVQRRRFAGRPMRTWIFVSVAPPCPCGTPYFSFGQARLSRIATSPQLSPRSDPISSNPAVLVTYMRRPLSAVSYDGDDTKFSGSLGSCSSLGTSTWSESLFSYAITECMHLYIDNTAAISVTPSKSLSRCSVFLWHWSMFPLLASLPSSSSNSYREGVKFFLLARTSGYGPLIVYIIW